MNKKLLAVAGIALMTMTMSFPIYADCGKGACSMGSHGKWGGGIKEKFFYKANLLLSVRDEIGLSEEQVQTIKDLKLETKKNYIRQNAEIKVLKLDIKSKLHGDKIDKGEIEKLIDAKYDAKKAMAKSMVDAYAKLKNVLNDKQRQALKERMKQWRSGRE